MGTYVNSIWQATANKVNQYGELQGDVETDVVIIGGGFTGLSTAYFLQQMNVRTVLIEQNLVGWGASGRNAGMLLTGYKKGMASLVQQFGVQTAAELLKTSIDSIQVVKKIVEENDLDCSFSACGNIKAAYKAKHLDQLKRNQEYLYRYFQYETEVLEPQEMSQELGSPIYHGLLVDSHGASFHPLQYALELAKTIVKLGGVIYEKTPVTRLEKKAGKVWVTTPKGVIKSDKIVIATNGYTPMVTKNLAKSILPIGSYIIATERLDPSLAKKFIPNNRMVSDTKKFLYYFRLTPDNRMLFGGRVSFNGKESPELYEELRKCMISVFPELKDVRVEYGWGGLTGFTMDQFPHFGITEEGYYYALGYCGSGAAMSSWMGRELARSITAKTRTDNVFEKFPLKQIPLHSQKERVLQLVGFYYSMYDKVN